jgi:hypothetical protein
VLGAEKEKKEPDGLFWAHAVDGRQRTLEDGNWWLTRTAHEDDLIGSLFRKFWGFCAQPVPGATVFGYSTSSERRDGFTYQV